MKRLTTLTAFLLLLPIQSAWIWEPWSFPDAPSGESGSFQLTPLYGNYEDGYDNDGVATPTSPANGVNQSGWDRAPESFTYSWTATNSSGVNEPIEIQQAGVWSRSPDGGYSFLDLYLDPDGDGILPDTLTLEVTFPFDLLVRNNGANGAIGLNVNPITQVFEGGLTSELANGAQVSLDSTYVYGTAGAPDSYTSGAATWDEVSGNGTWVGLGNGGLNTSDYFPWPGIGNTPDQAEALGKQTWVFSDFTGTGDRIRMSFDGGVAAGSNPTAQALALIPEPSSIFLLTIGVGGLMGRRRRR